MGPFNLKYSLFKTQQADMWERSCFGLYRGLGQKRPREPTSLRMGSAAGRDTRLPDGIGVFEDLAQLTANLLEEQIYFLRL